MKQATCNVLTLRVLWPLLTTSNVWLRDGPDCPCCMDRKKQTFLTVNGFCLLVCCGNLINYLL